MGYRNKYEWNEPQAEDKRIFVFIVSVACNSSLTPQPRGQHLGVMAGKKKSKKPAANPARGFATTSIASKPRVDPAESLGENTGPGTPNNNNEAAAPPTTDAPQTTTISRAENRAPAEELSPEEFERQLEESELQLLVDKYAQKVRRDAQRQKLRLETDRRLLRTSAEIINIKKWLPQELMDHILGLVQAEGRFAASSVSTEGATSRLPPEEDLIIKLWTLRQTLDGSGFPEDRIQSALQFVLDIAPNISPNSKGESIWGLEEVLDWFARECSADELPDYLARKAAQKSQAGTWACRSFLANSDDLRFSERNPLGCGDASRDRPQAGGNNQEQCT